METDTPVKTVKGRIDINAVENNPIVTPPRDSGRYNTSELEAKRKKYIGIPVSNISVCLPCFTVLNDKYWNFAVL